MRRKTATAVVLALVGAGAVAVAVAATGGGSDDKPAAAPASAVEVHVRIAKSIVTLEGAFTELRLQQLTAPDGPGPLRSAVYRGPMHDHRIKQALPVSGRARFRIASTVRECGGSCDQGRIGPPTGRCNATFELTPETVRRIEVRRTALTRCSISVR